MRSQAQDLEEVEQLEKQAQATRRPLEEIDEDIGNRISNQAVVRMVERTYEGITETITIDKEDKEAMRRMLIQVAVESAIPTEATHSPMRTQTRAR